MCCQEVDFAFIEDVGQKVNELLMNDANQVEWFNSVIEEYNLNGQYPPDLISEIIDYLTSADDEYYAQLAENIQLIIQDEDNIENLLGYIYFPATNEEEDTKCDDNINSPSFSGGIVSNDQDDFNEDESDSKAYFRRCIKKIMQTFYFTVLEVKSPKLVIFHLKSICLVKQKSLCQVWVPPYDLLLRYTL